MPKLKLNWKKLGPGIITGISDDDPSGIATYSQVGAALGLQLLWTALLTFPLMVGIEGMCARIGIVTSSGLIGVIHKHYSPVIAWIVLALIAPAIIFNMAANLASMGAILNVLFPVVPLFVFHTLVVCIAIVYMLFCNYKTIENIFKFFCLALICYFIVPFLVIQDWSPVLYATIYPHFEWNKEDIFLLVAILGTTISPYLFFWQSSYSHEEKKLDHMSNKRAIGLMRLDVGLGILASTLGMYFIILTAASVLHANGQTQIMTVQDAALALKPLAGELAFVIFSIGILGLGFLTIPVLAGCIGYMFSECEVCSLGLNKRPKEAPAFYGVIVITLLLALLINFIGIDPIQSLIWTAVLYGVITPPVLLLILLICNNKKIMGKYVNSIFFNIVGVIAFVLMSLAVVGLILI